MPVLSWDDIPERVKPKLKAAERDDLVVDGIKKIADRPERYTTGHEAIQFTPLWCGEWRIEFPEELRSTNHQHAAFGRLGGGSGFSVLGVDYGSSKPVRLEFSEPTGDLKGKTPAVALWGDPAVLVLNNSAYQILRSVEPLSDDRVLHAEAFMSGRRLSEPYFIVDPVASNSIIDVENSRVRWQMNGSGHWSYHVVEPEVAFRKEDPFHLRWYYSGLRLAISKDLLYTWFVHDVGLPGEYLDPHKVAFGYEYQPNLLVPV